MTTKVLTGTYAAGYSLTSPITTLSIASGGYVEGQGVHSASAAAYTVVNGGWDPVGGLRRSSDLHRRG